MPSELRLHPASVILGFGSYVRSLAAPGVGVLFAGAYAGLGWQAGGLLVLLPALLLSIVRYLTFRYRYEAGELVIRSGLFFRNERHVPYGRIQNLDARQSVVHRLLRVVTVRIETGGGQEPEAVMNALPLRALDEMRRQVFAMRAESAAAASSETDRREIAGEAALVPPPALPRLLLALSPSDLVIYGLIRNRGAVLLAAAVGAVWELGAFDRYLTGVIRAVAPARDAVGRTIGDAVTRGELPPAVLAAGLAVVLAAATAILAVSVGWAFVRLGGFRLSQCGDDLSMEYGLFERVTSTVPRRRIQAVGVQAGPLHRWTGRVSVRVETAAGVTDEEQGDARREWMAPLLRREGLADLLAVLLPGFDLHAVTWEPVAPRATARVRRRTLVIAAVACLPCVVWPGWWSAVVPPLAVVWALVAARQTIAHLGWAESAGTVCFRRGWIWRKLCLVPNSRVQVVSIHESPFDRRAGMARTRVDTAGATDEAFRVDIPFLARPVAALLKDRLASLSAVSGLCYSVEHRNSPTVPERSDAT